MNDRHLLAERLEWIQQIEEARGGEHRHIASVAGPAVLCASPAYITAKGAPERPQDLTDHACLGLALPQLWPEWRLRPGQEKVTVRVSGPIVSDEGGSMTVAGIAGAGINGRFGMVDRPGPCGGTRVRLLPEWRYDWTSAVHVVLPPGRFVPAKTRVFVDRLVKEFTPTAPWSR